MKKHIVFSFGILICLLFGITTTMFAQNQRTTNEYYPTDGPIQIIKSSASTVYGEGTQITMSLDFSDDTAFGIVGKKYQVSVYETKNSKKINSGDFTLNASKVLSGTMTGLVPETDYTLFIKPYINSVATDAKMSIAVRTNKPTTVLKQFSYGKEITSSKTIITLIATYEGVPEGEVVTFMLTNADTAKSKVDLKPTDTMAITPTTKQYTLVDTSTAGNEGKVMSVTVTLKNKEGLLFTQTKTVPDILNGQQTNANTNANNKTLASDDDYQFLTKLPGFNTASLCKEKDAQGNCIVYNFNEYLQALIKLTYSLIALVAVFQIMYYGAKTMWSVTPFGKAESKDRVYNAVMGIVIALGSYLILYTINPKLVNIHLGAPKVDIVNKNGNLTDLIAGFQPGDVVSNGQLPSGVICGGSGTTVKSIAESFIGHVSYEVGYDANNKIIGKGEPGLKGTINLDCSGYVDKVLACAGLPKTAGTDSGSAVNDHKGEAITEADISADGKTVKGIPLVPGDVLGWNTVRGVGYGHLVIYIGDGNIANSTSPVVTDKGKVNMEVVGKAVSVMPLVKYKNKYNQIFRVNPNSQASTELKLKNFIITSKKTFTKLEELGATVTYSNAPDGAHISFDFRNSTIGNIDKLTVNTATVAKNLLDTTYTISQTGLSSTGSYTITAYLFDKDNRLIDTQKKVYQQ